MPQDTQIIVSLPDQTVNKIREEGRDIKDDTQFFEWLRREIMNTLSYSFYPYGPFDVTIKWRER